MRLKNRVLMFYNPNNRFEGYIKTKTYKGYWIDNKSYGYDVWYDDKEFHI